MSLLSLPQELLLHILGYLGSSFFHEETRRLVVCKQWFASAHVVFLATIYLSSNTLERLLNTQTETGLSQLKHNLRDVSLRLQGFPDWQAGVARGPIDSETLDTWTNDLDRKLTEFVGILRNCTNLEAIQLKALPECRLTFANFPRWNYLHAGTLNYLHAGTLVNLLAVNNLTTLELDTWGTHLIMRNGGGENTHICLSISALLPNLRRLRLRMRSVCPIALRAPPGDSGICLAELIVNLSLYGDSSTDNPIAFSKQCGTLGHGGLLQLRRDMEERMSLLVSRMSYPKFARILSHSFPDPRMQSWDALTGRRMILRDGAAWDDDGRTIGSDQDTDLSDGDSESYF
jgi:hypothetical protein